MGSINFGPGTLADSLSETAGYKAGLALSIPELCDHLSGTEFPDLIRNSEEYGARLRSEEYEALFYKLLYRIGYTKEEYGGFAHSSASRFHKYRRKGLLDQYQGVGQIFTEMWPKLLEDTHARGSKSIDPTPFIIRCHEKYGKLGFEMGMEHLRVLNDAVTLNPHSISRAVEWTGALALSKLFTGTKDTPELGQFIDQRFVNYLSNNVNRLPEMHWRKFEQLTAEFFYREGFRVELGPGSNDDGVDVRVWKADSLPTESPLCIAQCKRQKDKVDKLVVKGLHADIQHEGASYGVIVTTSALSPGALSTISARGYPIQAVERDGLSKWLSALRTPGSGIVR